MLKLVNMIYTPGRKYMSYNVSNIHAAACNRLVYRIWEVAKKH